VPTLVIVAGEGDEELAMSTQASTQAGTQSARSDAGIFMFDPDAETMPREALSALQTALAAISAPAAT